MLLLLGPGELGRGELRGVDVRHAELAAEHDGGGLQLVGGVHGRVVRQVEGGEVALPGGRRGGGHGLDVAGDPLVEYFGLSID